MMDYRQSLDYLFSLQKFGIKLGLSSTRNLLERLGRPEQGLPILHIAGTNGKGSVGASVASILRQAGRRVGFFTSPHLVSFRERFAVDGRMIGREDVIRLTEMVRQTTAPEEPPTFFEFVTAMAFQYFKEQKVDLAIMEVGMGGRLDATNVADPLVSVITHISLEHQDYLGKTLKAIAGEKAGIIKPGRPVVVGERRKAILDVFRQTADALHSPLFAHGPDFRARRRPSGGFDYFGLNGNFKNLHTRLLGGHQVKNASLALAAMELLSARGLPVTEADVRKGLELVTWPGRAELLPTVPGQARIILDGAHNPDAARALANLLKETPRNRLHLVLGIMADKDIRSIMGWLLPQADALYLTRPEYSRAATVDALAEAASDYPGRVERHEVLTEAIRSAMAATGPDDLIVITGSLFTVGEARGFFMPETLDG